MRKKLAQMEIMGLAIIVILLSLALLFVIRFIILRPSPSISEEYTESILSANFISALIKTNAPDCSDIKFSTLFQDCASNNRDGTGGNIECGEGEYSCIYIREKMQGMLSYTFDEWNINYYFIASVDAENIDKALATKIFEPIGDWEPCETRRKGKPQPLPLDTPGDNVHLLLYICD
ncbi:MAG: hypothetical protein KAK00_09105 [Nanoarchaeota archaeon]|nr:hypothetical protein [Nanoarchaeota archaeon]